MSYFYSTLLICMMLISQFHRYYSNAFTDMVKQDAMNVFLGFYIPNEMLVPLWDLDSDYYLHNRISKPPTPYINRILYQENQLSICSTSSSRNASFSIETASNQDFGLSRIGGVSDETKILVHNEELRSEQEKVQKKYFINDRTVLSSSNPHHHSKNRRLITASGKGLFLKSDDPLQLQDGDHYLCISQGPLAHTPKKGVYFLYSVTNHVSLPKTLSSSFLLLGIFV